VKHATFAQFFERSTAFSKKAAEEREDAEGRRYLTALKHIGLGTLGFGTGIAAGRGAGHLISKVSPGQGAARGARVARTLAPVIGTASGLAYSLWKQEEQRRIQRAIQGS